MSYTLDNILAYYTAGSAAPSLLPKKDVKLSASEIATAATAASAAAPATLSPEQMQDEYNYYNTRYKYALDKYLSKDLDKTVQAAWYEKAKILNNRMYNLVAIIEQVAGKGGSVPSANAIQAQTAVLTSMGENREETYKKMVEFTREKVNASNNLLNLYAFLNIVALGVIFYVYRST